MWWKLEEELLTASNRRIREFETYRRVVLDENARRRRRAVGAVPEREIQRPETWDLDRSHDPFHVRRNRKSIAHAIRAKLRSGTYQPQRPAGFYIGKPSGGNRTISSFSIADEVISLRLFRSLMDKNRSHFSSRAYAYRRDLSPHDALGHVMREFSREQRVFVAEYDFSKFFDTISHEHIRQSVSQLGLVTTALEQELIEAFLRAPEPYFTLAEKSDPGSPRRVGIPQGTSISLFLANVAASGLDRSLERLGVGFVRYADDTLIWSHTYSEITEAVDALHDASAKIGSPINLSKSHGVRLLVPEGTLSVEMASTPSVSYLGHELGLRKLSLRKGSFDRIRSRVNELIYANLLREPQNGTQSVSQLTDLDRDYVTYVWQLRRYLYGGLSENQVRRFQHGRIPPMSFQGAMSYFPLVDDDAQLRALDVWIATQTWLAVRRRKTLLQRTIHRTVLPWGLDREALIGLTTKAATTGDPLDLRLPSVRRISQAIQLGIRSHGLGVVSDADALYLYDES